MMGAFITFLYVTFTKNEYTSNARYDEDEDEDEDYDCYDECGCNHHNQCGCNSNKGCGC